MRTSMTVLAIALGTAVGVARVALAADPPTATAHVTYVSGSSIYVDAGSDDGLAVGDALLLVRDGVVSRRLVVTYATAHKATCSAEGPGPEIAIGDVLRFMPHANAADASTPSVPGRAQPAARSGESGFHRAGLRGRIGARYLSVTDRTGLGQNISQPSLDLLLLGTQIGGRPVDLNVDVRARRTYRTPVAGSKIDDGANHVYEANVAWRGGPFRVALGRQVSPTLAVVSLFDGLVTEYRHKGWSAGLLAGAQPDPVSYSYSSDVKQYGLYGGYASDPAKRTRWNLGFGAISSTEKGEINRDFAFVEARVTHRIVGIYLQQQVDINRGWRKDAEGDGLTPSGTFVMVHLRPAPSFALDAGYDSRRNVRVYRDLVTPVTVFDDATREGVWLGAAWRPRNRWLVGLDGRRSSGGSAGTTNAYTLRLGALNMTKEQIDVQLRGTRYSGPRLDGSLASLSGSMNLASRVRLELHAGARRDSDLLGFDATTTIDWIGTALDVFLGRSVYFNLAYDRTSGGDEDNDQAYAAFSWRF